MPGVLKVICPTAKAEICPSGCFVAGKVEGCAYDRLTNPLSRTDGNTKLSESFRYDSPNRLTKSTISLSPTPLVKTFSNSSIGNLLSKSDVRDSAAMLP
jgi:hypothetical protein